jgi:Xaa-Pro aminopeptidase
MLSADGCKSRQRRLWNALPAPCDALVIGDPQHLVYFTNYYQSPFLFRSVEAAALAVLEPGRATLVGDNLLEPFVAEAHVDAAACPTWYDGRRSTPHRGNLLVRTALGVLEGIGVKRVGVELSRVPAGLIESLRATQPGLEIIDLDPLIRPLRRAKDVDELGVLRRAMKAVDAGQDAGLNLIEPGMTELEASLVVQRAATEALGSEAWLYGDFVSGPRCEQIGGPPSSRRIEKGDLFILDFSVVVHGYRGDFANTFVVGGGAPTPRQQQLFEACVAALESGETGLRPGAAAQGVYAAVRGSFESRGLALNFTTHAGHGVGFGHPEPPYFVPESDETLVAGDVVTIEPGQYVAGVAGMRYERNYLITRDGFETLSGHRIAIRR